MANFRRQFRKLFELLLLTLMICSLQLGLQPKALTLEASNKKSLHEHFRVVNRTPSTFDTINAIDMKFGTYNEHPLHFQLSVVTWCLIGLHGNHSYINDVTSGLRLGFLSFQILF